jgi:lipoyl(octanoyl) transferase
MNLVLRHLGVEDYVATWEAMRSFTLTRDAGTPDELWFLQHQSVFTQGQAGKPEHILDPHGIPVVHSDRGGQVTYHGPGQLVVYFLLDVRRRGYGVRTLVDIIETSLLEVLRSYDLAGELRKGAPGVYVEGRKIAALGLRISKGCSLHGLSFNIDMDLAPFTWINPCGYEGLVVTQLADLLDKPRTGLFEETRARLVETLQSRLL